MVVEEHSFFEDFEWPNVAMSGGKAIQSLMVRGKEYFL